VTQTHYALIYSYAANTLWLAYGIALGMTLLSILLGVVSIYHNSGFSYMSRFSTILRVAHCIDLEIQCVIDELRRILRESNCGRWRRIRRGWRVLSFYVFMVMNEKQPDCKAYYN
jgi:hypothetical protein